MISTFQFIQKLFIHIHNKYYQNEINYKGKITKLSFRHYSGDFENTNHWCIYMGHTEKTEFNNTRDWVQINNLIQVFDGDVSNYL